MHKQLFIIFAAILLVFSKTGFGQSPQEITIEGQVTTKDVSALYSLMIVNKRTNLGLFGNPDGSFVVEALQSDTILIGAVGFATFQLTFKDSVPKERYKITITLQPLQFQLKQVEVTATRSLEEIEEEIKELGYNENDYRVSGIEAFKSPITFLYQEFSRRERSKRKAIELENESRRRDLMRELLAKYVHYDIIQLKDEQFDSFIDFCQITDSFLQNTQQYDFIMYIKMRYSMFRERRG